MPKMASNLGRAGPSPAHRSSQKPAWCGSADTRAVARQGGNTGTGMTAIVGRRGTVASMPILGDAASLPSQSKIGVPCITYVECADREVLMVWVAAWSHRFLVPQSTHLLRKRSGDTGTLITSPVPRFDRAKHLQQADGDAGND